MTYTEAVAELEAILEQLREVPADIDQLNARVARAEELVALIRARLRGAEESIDRLQSRTDP